MNSNITPAQVRDARALLLWSRIRLSAAADVSIRSLEKFEREDRSLEPSAVAFIQAVLEAAGVEFTNGDSPGVKLVPRPKPGAET